jgi:hypothetical protein
MILCLKKGLSIQPRRALWCVATVLLIHSSAWTADSQEIAWLPGVKIRFASRPEGVKHLALRDAYTSAMSELDIALRLGKMDTTAPITIDNYLYYASNQATEWPVNEQKMITQALDELTSGFRELKVRLPATVLLIRTSGGEEHGTAYCRNGAIILPHELAQAGGHIGMKRLLAHELFHITSVHNPELRRQLYEIVGYLPCTTVILNADLEEHLVTNPDALGMNYYATYEYKGELHPMLPISYSRRTRGKPFPGVRYVSGKQLVLVKQGSSFVPRIKDGRPLILNNLDVTEYTDRLGSNTRYIDHPEEALAENFSLLVTGASVNDPDLLARIRKCFIEYAGP